MNKYLVSVELFRKAELIIEAPDALMARSKASNFEFDSEFPSELVGWRIADVRLKIEEGPAVISEATALSLAIEQIHKDKTVAKRS